MGEPTSYEAPGSGRAAAWFLRCGGLTLGLSIALLIAVATWPITLGPAGRASVLADEVPCLEVPPSDAEALVQRLAGSALIRPGRVQPAVKDSGVAQALLDRLKLQSVASLRGEPVAYVRVEAEGVRSVRVGQRLLDFRVESVEPGRVGLTLDDGVGVALGY
jgi:hypothetical protein